MGDTIEMVGQRAFRPAQCGWLVVPLQIYVDERCGLDRPEGGSGVRLWRCFSGCLWVFGTYVGVPVVDFEIDGVVWIGG